MYSLREDVYRIIGLMEVAKAKAKVRAAVPVPGPEPKREPQSLRDRYLSAWDSHDAGIKSNWRRSQAAYKSTKQDYEEGLDHMKALHYEVEDMHKHVEPHFDSRYKEHVRGQLDRSKNEIDAAMSHAESERYGPAVSHLDMSLNALHHVLSSYKKHPDLKNVERY